MAKTTKLFVLFSVIVAATALTVILFLLSNPDDVSLVDQLSDSQVSGSEDPAEVISKIIEDHSLAPGPRTPVPVQAQTYESKESITDLDSDNEYPESFSPVLGQVVTRQQLEDDIEAWEQDMHEKGLVSYFKGAPAYPLYDPNGAINDPDSLHKYFDETVEELVALVQQGDPAAMLALANRAWAAGRWSEGDVYAVEAVRIAGSTEPILHGGSQRLRRSPMAYEDRDGASWFLAAYLEGNLAAAMQVEAYFRAMSVEDQLWALNRAYEIINEINQGG